MHVDRSRFLLLTASLALAACGSPKPKTSPDAKDAKAGKTDAAPDAAKTDAGAKSAEPSTPETATPPGPKAGAGAGPSAAGSPAMEGEEPSPVNES
jgi:hypothetical protein